MLPKIDKWYYDGKPLRCAWCGSTKLERIENSVKFGWEENEALFKCECKMFIMKKISGLSLQQTFDF